MKVSTQRLKVFYYRDKKRNVQVVTVTDDVETIRFSNFIKPNCITSSFLLLMFYINEKFAQGKVHVARKLLKRVVQNV